jgi:hypothetical protein
LIDEAARMPVPSVAAVLPVKKEEPVGAVDVIVQRLGHRVELGEVARDGGGGERLERAELSATGGEAATGGVCQSTVASVTTDWLPSLTWIWPLPVEVTDTCPYWLRSSRIWSRPIEQVVGALPGLDGGGDRLVQLREACGGRP